MQSLPKTHFITRQIRRTSRNVIIGNIIVLLIASFVLFRQRHSLFNLLQGPFQMTPTEILQNQTYKSYYKIKTDYTLDGGVHSTDTLTTYLKIRLHVVKLKDAIKEHYVIGIIDNKPLLIEVPLDFKVPDNHAGMEFQGVTYKFPGDATKFPEFYPFLFDSTGKPSGVNYWVLGICLFIISINLGYVFKHLIRLLNPAKHPLFKYNHAEKDVSSFSEKIEAELASPTEVNRFKEVTITRTWFIRNDLFEINIIPNSAIRWVYGEVDEKNKNADLVEFTSPLLSHVWVHPSTIIWNSKTIIICTGTGRMKISISNDKLTDAAKIIDSLLQRTDRFLLGYSKELENVWDTQSDELFALLDSGKEDIKAVMLHFNIDPATIEPSRVN